MIEENYMGLACPEPVVRCRAFISEKAPEVFTILVDNQGSSENVKRFLEKNGYIVTVERTQEKEWQLVAMCITSEEEVEKSHTTDRELNQPLYALGQKASTDLHLAKTLVVIPTENLGNGDDLLGKKLMESFLSTLSELSSLWKVILLNGGVKLAAQDGKALESLQKLEEEGIEILVCGTCLEFYGLTSLKRVGQTTNMLDIITASEVADKVINL